MIGKYYIKIEKKGEKHVAKLIFPRTKLNHNSEGVTDHVIEDDISTSNGYLELQKEIASKGWIDKLNK